VKQPMAHDEEAGLGESVGRKGFAATAAPAPGGAGTVNGIAALLSEHEVFIVLKKLGSFATIGLLWLVLWYGDRQAWWGLSLSSITTAMLTVLSVLIAWHAIDRATRLYLLTDKRVVRVSGVFRQTVWDIPLIKLQSVTVHRSTRERVFGLATIVFASAGGGGAGGAEFSWFMVGNAVRNVKIIRETLAKYGQGGIGGVQ
jgi:membrane protein YdbS with pleckstrin-like domain